MSPTHTHFRNDTVLSSPVSLLLETVTSPQGLVIILTVAKVLLIVQWHFCSTHWVQGVACRTLRETKEQVKLMICFIK